jgi:fructose/tagatose bisphosphate aldolase
MSKSEVIRLKIMTDLPSSIKNIIGTNVSGTGEKVAVHAGKWFESDGMDELARMAVFGDQKEKKEARLVIRKSAKTMGINSESINDFYMAVGEGEIKQKFSVPAFNLRGMTYDLARIIFRIAIEQKVGVFIFEIARSEMEYTGQNPDEFVVVILAAGLREGYRGPVFIQGDHFQTKLGDKPGMPLAGEVEAIKALINEALKAGFYNIDIDCSTLVDLEKETEDKQQESNIRYTAELLKFIRGQETKSRTISIGGEIGHIGGKNSTVKDFTVFMDGLEKACGEATNISKVSVQTGSSHGGVVLANGTVQRAAIDFSVLNDISQIARQKYGLGGAVQHGASTLPDGLFERFPQTGAIEVHLATGLQNLIFDHEAFPNGLKEEIYQWIDRERQQEKLDKWTNEQFHYKLRKKAWGKFKKKLWDLDKARKEMILKSLAERIKFLFSALKVAGTKDLIKPYISGNKM